MAARFLLLAVLSLLGACSSLPRPAQPPAAPAQVPTTRPADDKPSAGPLKTERAWLQAWFRGTPVQIAERGDGAVAIEVPRAFCFEPGRSELKPALAAVLDKLAESLRRVPSARLGLAAAPDDGAGPLPALAQERATRVLRHLQSRGVPAARLAKPTSTAAAAVQLRMDAAAPAP